LTSPLSRHIPYDRSKEKEITELGRSILFILSPHNDSIQKKEGGMNRTVGFVLAAVGLFLSRQAAQADWTPARGSPGILEGPGSQTLPLDTSDNLHLVWLDGTPGNDEIYYRKSTDGGATWTPAKRLTWTSSGSGSPELAVDPSDNLHIVWQDSTPGNAEIYYENSTDGGNTWTMSKRLSWTSGQSYGPTIAVDSSGNIHVSGRITRRATLRSITGKARMEEALGHPEKGSPGLRAVSFYPGIAVDSSSNLHVVWWDDTPGSWIWRLYYKKSPDGGASWTTGKRLTWNAGYSIHPAIVVISMTISM